MPHDASWNMCWCNCWCCTKAWVAPPHLPSATPLCYSQWFMLSEQSQYSPGTQKYDKKKKEGMCEWFLAQRMELSTSVWFTLRREASFFTSFPVGVVLRLFFNFVAKEVGCKYFSESVILFFLFFFKAQISSTAKQIQVIWDQCLKTNKEQINIRDGRNFPGKDYKVDIIFVCNTARDEIFRSFELYIM